MRQTLLDGLRGGAWPSLYFVSDSHPNLLPPSRRASWRKNSIGRKNALKRNASIKNRPCFSHGERQKPFQSEISVHMLAVFRGKFHRVKPQHEAYILRLRDSRFIISVRRSWQVRSKLMTTDAQYDAVVVEAAITERSLHAIWRAQGSKSRYLNGKFASGAERPAVVAPPPAS